MSYRGGANAFGQQPSSPSPLNPINTNSAFNSRAGNNGSNTTGLKKFQKSFEAFANKVEDYADHPVIHRLKPYTPSIARFFIVATFYEDSFRILSQWKDQVFYLWNYRHIPYFLVILFLLAVVVSMVIGSTLILLPRTQKSYTLYASIALISCVILQALAYGLISGFAFVLRNISVIGGLVIALGDSIVTHRTTFGMLPELTSKNGEKRNYFLFAGRILIVLMFISFTFTKNWFTVVLTILGTVCISIGYKTKFASIILFAILTFYNVSINNYWFYDSNKRDFLKYEFYQNLSIMGGLLLVLNTGAGDISLDQKKKIY
ncbi:probable ER-derived vesicles protein ERV29 [Saccharomycodes ludwigii]|uniref:Probable ER-derived vesicles protein ERV29 n=1 Tax=Saccharomycodes ludwigii TaxID=36035 RepID=A0A376B7V7_9ASCO|nr:hypothetical protein SCDLUD_004431 [Saccharomycodes ludwigii]KAH3899010.1 hypothetical protein SCDLUD_004431 [Saccharomycodes ludwigii]SSD60659.1 probable ER-derived vesicles protein ERV29 [Saccharomycodes ludwigii]